LEGPRRITSSAKYIPGASSGHVCRGGAPDEILTAAAVEVLNLLSEDYRARVACDSHDRHGRSRPVQNTQIRNSIPDVHDRDKAITPRAVNPNRQITVPSTQREAGDNKHFSNEVDFGARCWSHALP
jgi:hypothetical protein